MICFSCGNALENDTCGCGGPALLAERYRMERVIGHGASGTTWRGTDTTTGEAVAIKEMPLRQADSPKARELIEREARVLRELDHPGIPRWRDAVVAGSGRFRALYLVQELVAGRTLAEEMMERRYTVADVLDVADELLGILSYLHTLSPPVVHRDLKPANVMRRDDGRIVLLDFGAVRDALKGELGGSTVAGTFGYMAPEQFHGDAWPVTDLYGLGALLVALLTRRDPQGMLDHAQRIVYERHLDAPPELTSLLQRLLAPEAVDRPVSAAHVRTSLRALREVGFAEKDRSGAKALFDPVDVQVPARGDDGMHLVRARRAAEEDAAYRTSMGLAVASLALSSLLGVGGWIAVWWLTGSAAVPSVAASAEVPTPGSQATQMLNRGRPDEVSEYFRSLVVERGEVPECFESYAAGHPEARFDDVLGFYLPNEGRVHWDVDHLDGHDELRDCLDARLTELTIDGLVWEDPIPFVVTLGYPTRTPDKQALWTLLY